MKDLHHWVCFRLVPDKKKPDKPRKVPINPMTGGEAKSNDPATWSDFGTAAATRERLSLDGIGFMFSGSGYFGVDLDGVADRETGELTPQALEIVEALDSYTEWSPSCTGMHIICRGSLPPGARRGGFL